MNKNLLESVMKANGDTGTTLSLFLGMARSTFSAKINGNGAEFTQGEIAKIKKKYLLDADNVDKIFFSQKVSEKTQNEA